MKKIYSFLNSPLGLLLCGATISGLLVPIITFKWQENEWYNQQEFTAKQSLFQKNLDEKYRLVTEANEALADILTHSQLVAVCCQKNVSSKQMNSEINKYNDAVTKWEKKYHVIKINLEAFFTTDSIFLEWETIKKLRDKLDVILYRLQSSKSIKVGKTIALINDITAKQVHLSKLMLAEIKFSKRKVTTFQ